MRLEIIVLRQDARTEELFLENLHEIEQALRLAPTCIVYSVWRYGQTILASLSLWCLLYNSYNTFYNIIYISEIPLQLP